jgi:hypothetical protein
MGRILDWFSRGDGLSVDGGVFHPERSSPGEPITRQLKVTVENHGSADVALKQISVIERGRTEVLVPLWDEGTGPLSPFVPFVLQPAQVWTGTTPLEAILKTLSRTGVERTEWHLTLTAHDDAGREHSSAFDLKPLF